MLGILFIAVLAPWVLLAGAAETPAIKIPWAYSVVTSVNSNEVGFTYARKEYYDPSQNLFRTDGNVTNAAAINVYDFSKKTYTTFDPHSSPTVCTVYDMTGVNNSYLLQPSVNILHAINISEMTCQADNIDARDIPSYFCYLSRQNEARTVKTYFYYAMDTLLPVRLVRATYLNTSLSTPLFSMYYDWVNWVVSDSIRPSIFSTPTSGCVQSSDTSLITPYPPLNSTVNNATLDPGTPFPTLTSSFSTVLEYKTSLVPELGLLGVNWYYDSNSDVERFDTTTNTIGYTSSQIYNYTAGYVYFDYNDEICIPDYIRNNTVFMPPVFQYNLYGEPDTARKILIPTSAPTVLTNFDLTNAEYTGHTPNIRGVVADTWKIAGITSGNYTFDTYVYFFPQGWQFPGRTLGEGSIPLRIYNTGYYTTSNGVNASFTQEWDLFLYFSTQPDTSLLNPVSIGCAYPPTLRNASITIPPQYNVFISMYNVTSGISYSYQEFAIRNGGISRKFFYHGDQFIVDAEEGNVYVFFPYNQTRQCLTFPYSLVNVTEYNDYLLVLEATANNVLFELLPFFFYNTTTTVARSILADYYVLPFTNFELGLYVDFVTRYPIRMTMSSPMFGELAIEYVDWVVGPQDPSVFFKPTGCVLDTVFYSRLGHFSSTYNPSAPVNTTLPATSNQFYMVLEGKLGDSPITEFVWYYDGVAQLERIEQTVGTTGPTNVFTYDYANNRTYSYTSGGACNNVSMVHNDTDSNISLLAQTRVSFIHEFFDPNFRYNTIRFNYNSAVYQGLFPVREVSAPKWTYPTMNVNSTDGYSYTFDASVYFFPEGWAFPLRNLTAGTRIPMRIELKGNYSNGIDSTPFTDVWDFLLVNPGAPAPSAFSPCVLSLIPVGNNTTPVATTGATGSTTTGSSNHDNGLSSGAKAAIAVIIIIAVVALVVGIYLTVRRRRILNATAGKGGGGGGNRTFEQMNDNDI